MTGEGGGFHHPPLETGKKLENPDRGLSVKGGAPAHKAIFVKTSQKAFFCGLQARIAPAHILRPSVRYIIATDWVTNGCLKWCLM